MSRDIRVNRSPRLRTKDEASLGREMNLNSSVQQPLARICNSDEPERDINARMVDDGQHLDAWAGFNAIRISPNWRQFAGRRATWQFLPHEDV